MALRLVIRSKVIAGQIYVVQDEKLFSFLILESFKQIFFT